MISTPETVNGAYLEATRKLKLPSKTPVDKLLADYFTHMRARRKHKSAETDTGTRARLLVGLSTPVRSVAFSRDGRLVAAGGDEGRVLVWDSGTGTNVRILTNKGKLNAVAFSPDSKSLLCAGDEQVLWNLASGERKLSPGKKDSRTSASASSMSIERPCALEKSAGV